MRICVFSERLALPFDEGIKNYALNLARELAQDHDVLTLTAYGESLPAFAVENLPANPLLFSPRLAARVQEFEPDLIIYVPTACATLFSFWRARRLKAFSRGAPVALVALQPRAYGYLARALMPRLRPDLVIVQSELTQGALASLGCHTSLVPPAIDLERFQPASAARQVELRRQYGLDPEVPVVLHVGHLNRGRNVQALARLPSLGMQVVVVGSTSTPHDQGLVDELLAAGVRVMTQYVADIAQIYQLADCYVFPVMAETGAIDVPLSVLEAMACDLAVVTTRFGGLPQLFASAPGLRYVDNAQQLCQAVEACRGLSEAHTRAMVAPYAWSQAVGLLLEHICRELRLCDDAPVA
jgi:glycosyltransferase involved in cell wall biosynthesis